MKLVRISHPETAARWNVWYASFNTRTTTEVITVSLITCSDNKDNLDNRKCLGTFSDIATNLRLNLHWIKRMQIVMYFGSIAKRPPLHQTAEWFLPPWQRLSCAALTANQ